MITHLAANMALRSSRTLFSFCCSSVKIPEASGSSYI